MFAFFRSQELTFDLKGFGRKNMDKQLQEKLTRKRWAVLAASCFINLCIGSLYAWSVFAVPMAEHLNIINGTSLTSADLAIVFTVANSVGPITLISGGYINDKIGPKWVIFAGGLLFGAGMLLSSVSKTIPMLIVGYGLGCGLGMGLVYGCTISNSVKFFPKLLSRFTFLYLTSRYFLKLDKKSFCAFILLSIKNTSFR